MDDELKRMEFRARLLRQKSLSRTAVAAGVSGMLLAQALPCGYRPPVYGVTLAVVAVILFLSFRNWRCPSCGRLLGTSLDIGDCPHCKFKF